MKAILEFDLPEDSHEHAYAISGVDALIVIEDILNEIRNKLKYDGGVFKNCDADTLEEVRDFIVEAKQSKNLPELI
jgi:hypothetical protein